MITASRASDQWRLPVLERAVCKQWRRERVDSLTACHCGQVRWREEQDARTAAVVAGSTEMVAAGESSCDGRAFTCRDALLSCPVTDLQPPPTQFSETKV